MMALFIMSATGFGQTFRGGINGTVTDQAGAVVAGAQVTAVQTETNVSFKSVSSSAGEFAFSNLGLGDYSVTISATGFASVTVKNVTVSAATSYTLPVRLGVAGTSTSVVVTADALTVDTASDVQSTSIPEVEMQNMPNIGRDYTMMLSQVPGFAGAVVASGGTNGTAAMNGNRSNTVNWQLEGTDNNDIWWNFPAINQGGVNAIAGILLPVDAVANFSFTSAGTTEIGRNPGGTANVTIKSGTNALHGSAFYFNHNEFFQASNPLTVIKPAARAQNYGFSVGGPIRKNKTFFFLSGEHQEFMLGTSVAATEPTTAYQTLAKQVLAFYGVPVNTVSTNLLNGNGTLAALWPASALVSTSTTGLAAINNYQASGMTSGHSFNGIAKFDEQLTDKDHIAFNWFIGQGNSTGPYGSYLTPYFEVAPIHVQNYSLVYNRLLTTSMANQLSAGVSYYNQTFSDADTKFDPNGLGLDTGVTSPSLPGAPNLVISSFDALGVNTPSGRNDITGHLNDDLTMTKGAHQLHFGGEYRQAQVDDFYQTSQRGLITFDGTQGPWSTSSSLCSGLATQNLGVALPSSITTDPLAKNLADFMAGCPDAAKSSIVLGNPKRQVFANSVALYGQDAWQVTKKLNLNFGLRYDYQGPMHTDYADLSIFDPALPSGLAVVGAPGIGGNVPSMYPKFWKDYSPRAGFSYQIGSSNRTVLRGGYGLYGDTIYMYVVMKGSLSNMSPFGAGFNPAGSSRVANAGGLNMILQSGMPIFPTYAQALVGTTSALKISTYSQSLRTPYTQTIDLNVQHSFTSSVVWQVGYVGTIGTHLLGYTDLNPGALNSANVSVPYSSTTCLPQYSGATPTKSGNNLQCSRPYFSQFPQFGVIDQLNSNLGSNYDSLQTTLRVQNWHQLSAQLGYTWSHSLDYNTSISIGLPQNPSNWGGEYGNSNFDVRQTLNGFANYQVPQLRGPARLTKGWELNSGFSFHAGMPFNVKSTSAYPSGNGESTDRALMVGNPTSGVSHAIVANKVRWFNTSSTGCTNCFIDEPKGVYSPTKRNQLNAPGYADIDLAVIKNTPINHRVSAQFRADLFNIYNRLNLSYPSLSETGGTIGSTQAANYGAPSIGPGEPFSVRWALKILF
jgi:hypothetical protein